jgi:copper chaperone
MNMTTVKIKGMRCNHCVGSVRKALEALEGVSDVRVDLDLGEASFEGRVSPDEVRKAIAGIGFEVVEEAG